jgi:hypothetical protein
MTTRFTRPMLFCLLFLLMISPAVLAQQQQTVDEGTVVSATKSTLLMRTDAGDYKLFELTSDTTRPKSITPGSAVKVTSSATPSGAPVASLVEVTTAAAAGTKPPPSDTVPPSMRRMERSIQRQASKYRIGIRAGAALDPEQVLIGVHGAFGPLFSANLYARPNLEFMFGEVTDIVALNLEAIYRVPGTLRGSRWQFYFGGGPAFNFVKLGFEDQTEGFSFDDFNFDAGLNLIAGVQSKGMFLELKATAYAEPSIRFIIGYSF